MSGPRQPRPGPDGPWYLRRPTSDESTGIARSQPHSPPPAVPWYLEPPDRRPPPAEIPAGRGNLIPWLLVGAGGLALLGAVAVLVTTISELGIGGGTTLDVGKVQLGVLQTLSDPAGGYGANTVTDVSCNGGRNPNAAKGTTFSCDATVNGSQRHVAVVVSDDNGTYEVDGPR